MPAEVVTTSHVQKSPPKWSGNFAIKTKVESVPIGEELRLNLEYFRTVPGILKLVQLVCHHLFLTLISVANRSFHHSGDLHHLHGMHFTATNSK